jgi:hypothetical protein
MTPDDETRLWRNRFILLNLIRIGGTIGVLLSILLWQGDSFVRGGSILGFPLALLFLVVSFFGPRYAARQWRTPPEP